jgi:hypothetical protein
MLSDTFCEEDFLCDERHVCRVAVSSKRKFCAFWKLTSTRIDVNHYYTRIVAAA